MLTLNREDTFFFGILRMRYGFAFVTTCNTHTHGQCYNSIRPALARPCIAEGSPMTSDSNSQLDSPYKLSVTAACIVIVCVAAGWIAEYMSAILILVAVSLLTSYVLLAPVCGIEHTLKLLAKHSRLTQLAQRAPLLGKLVPAAWARIGAILIVYMATALFIGIIAIRFVPETFSQLQSLSRELPVYFDRAEDWVVSQPVLRGYLHGELTHLEQKGLLELTEEEQIQLRENPDGPLSDHEKQEVLSLIHI